MTKYRLYVDEVGNSHLGSSADPNHRYLSLSGLIINLEYVQDVIYPVIESLKREFFGSHPDEPIVLHRKELVNRKYPFLALKDPEVEGEFNARLLKHLNEFEYSVLTAVIDKQAFVQQYVVWQDDPYRYCLEILSERYVLWLERRNCFGDVMAESRGGKEDQRLKRAFDRVVKDGTSFVGANQYSACLTSQELKVKPKATNVVGLQLADLIAHPSYIATKCRNQNIALPDNFGGQIAEILENTKYVRSPAGKIDGWGRKWLP